MAGASSLSKGLKLFGIASACAALLAGSATSAPSATLTIRVDALDFAYKLSRRSVPAGTTVRFVVRNRGAAPHDLVIVGKKRTRVLRAGQRQTITARFPKAGAFRFLCSVPGHARLGMKGALGVSTPPPPPEVEPPSVDTSDVVSLTRIGDLDRPVLVTAPRGDTERVFVVEQAGLWSGSCATARHFPAPSSTSARR